MKITATISCTNLVTSGIAQTGEERGELAAHRGGGIFLEDDLVEATGGRNLGDNRVSLLNIFNCVGKRAYSGLVAHQTLCRGINLSTQLAS